MTKFEIVAAKPSDIEEIMSLEFLGFPCGIAEYASTMLARLNHFPAGFFIARECIAGRVVGYICSELWVYRETVQASAFTLNHGIKGTHNPCGTELYISSMTIHPDFRGCGLGRKLLLTCINVLQKLNPELHSAILMVSEDWRHARQIYDKANFSELFRIEGFFVPDGAAPSAAIVMRLKIH